MRTSQCYICGFLTFFVLVSGFSFTSSASAKTDGKRGPSEAVSKQIELENARLAAAAARHESVFAGPPPATTVRPFADYETVGYVFFNDDVTFGSRAVKRAIVENMPKDVTAVVFLEDDSAANLEAVRKAFGKNVTADRLKLVKLSGASNGFWARDGLPVPVISKTSKEMELVDAKYYYPFSADDEVAELFGSVVDSHSYYFEGGNFMANDGGICLIVNNSRHARIPNKIFESKYGCTSLVRLPFESGIGHVDEHVRFIAKDTVLTDLEVYRGELEAAGLKVVLLPRPMEEIETYVNSLIVNGVAIVPTFNEPTDQEALDVYTAAGFTVVAVDSNSLSNDGEGSVHCITMTYPPVPFVSLAKTLNFREL